MSGIFCDGCGEGDLVPQPGGPGRRPVACDLCGWTADAEDLPRKWSEEDAPAWTKRERKQAGRLFFLWIDLDPRNDEAVSRVMGILGIHGMSVAPRSLVELEDRPSEAVLRSLSEVPGVTRAWVAP